MKKTDHKHKFTNTSEKIRLRNARSGSVSAIDTFKIRQCACGVKHAIDMERVRV